jgi:hypothetical protein
VKQASEVVVVCEDDESARFVRHCVVELRIVNKARQVRVEMAPSGKGDGKAFVDQRIAAELQEFRRRSFIQSKLLVVCTDCDTSALQAR